MGKVASVLVVVVALIGIANVIPQKTIERIFSTGKEISSGTLNERSVIWANAYEEWEESPIYGHGLGSFRRIINPYNVDYTAHNSFVAITAEQGIVGTVLYLVVIGIAAASALRLSGDDRWLMLLMLLMVMIGQMSLTLQDRMYIWFAYALIVLNFYIKNNAPRRETLQQGTHQGMKKIAIVIAELAAPGGAEKVAVDLAEEFRLRHYEVTVVKFARLPADTIRHDIPVRMINLDIPERPGGFFTQIAILLQRAWQFRKLFQREQFDHIFSFLEAANVPCALACADSVLSVHLDPSTMTRSEWLAFRWLYPRAKRVIAVSRQMQDLLENRAHLKNVNCIYNPVNTRLVREKANEPLGIEGRFILAVGRLERQKRFDLLIEAFARTKAQQDCKLVIVGRGSQQPVLEQQIKALGLERAGDFGGV